MTGVGKFSFTFVEKKTCLALDSKDDFELLTKWGLMGCLKVSYYNFDEEFRTHHKQELVESFFKDPSVYTTLNTVKDVNGQFRWTALGCPATRVDYTSIPCSVTTMKFFAKLLNPENEIVASDGHSLIQCFEGYLDGIPIMNNLRCMLLLEDHPTYQLFTNYERQQFIFIIFKHICLGGILNQYEETIDAYLYFTKKIYKDLLRVERFEKNNELFIKSIVIEVKVYGPDSKILCPEDNRKKKFTYLIVDPCKRQLSVLQIDLDGFVAWSN